MLPFVYGFTWNPGTIIFLGLFFTVVAIIGVTLVTSIRRTLRDIAAGETDHLRWHADFHDLPTVARTCRHEYTGEFRQRSCDNEFNCRNCATHARLLALRPVSPEQACTARIEGFELPLDRLYHRGHTWVRPESDGTVTIGLDQIAERLVGTENIPVLPSPGSHLHVNGTAWYHKQGPAPIRILSPVDGEVVEIGGPSVGWLLKVRPATENMGHLLSGSEVGPWFRKEYERLQRLFADPKVGLTMADGGIPVKDFSKAYPGQNWDAIYGDMFLEA